MQAVRCLPVIMKYPLILCSVLASLSITIARKHGPQSGSPDLRIVGGHEASLRSHPYIVSLQQDFLFVKSHLCGGSLLNQRWILTAAHCVTVSWFWNWLSMVAVVGTNDNKNKDSTAQTVRISERIPHPNYDRQKFIHDIAMLKTAKNIQYNDAVSPIKFSLPMRGTQKTQNLIVAGWGRMGLPKPPHKNLPTEKLQEVRVEYLPYDECRKAVFALVEAVEDSADEEVESLERVSHICTGPITGGVSTCFGDSGGPLIQYISLKDMTPDTKQITTEDNEYENTASDDNDLVNEEFNDNTRQRKSREDDSTENTDESSATTRKVFKDSAGIVQYYKDHGLIPVVIGIVSFGIGDPCGQVGSPSVYTNVSTYADFIHKHLYD